MVELYKHKTHAISHLQRVRLNPDFAKKSGERRDLEFYLPQLASFYLSNDLPIEAQNQLVSTLLQASKRNFYFAHRLWYFLNSNITED